MRIRRGVTAGGTIDCGFKISDCGFTGLNHEGTKRTKEMNMSKLPDKTFLKPCEIMAAYGMSRPEFRKVRGSLTEIKLTGYTYPKFRRSDVLEMLGSPK